MKNKVIIKGDIAEIHVDSSKKLGHQIVLIDAADLPLLKDIKSIGVSDQKAVHGKKSYIYAVLRIKGKKTTLHRYLMGYTYNIKGKIIDHRNHNRLDNRRSTNLRIGDRTLNAQNREGSNQGNPSGICGVSWDKKLSKWRSGICANGKQHYLGVYETLEEAARVVKKAKRELHVG